MGVGRDMTWARYTDDAGGFHSVKVNKANYDVTASGFTAFNAADPFLAARYMRNIVGHDGASGDTQTVHVGTSAAALWTAATFDYPRLGEPDLTPDVTFTVILKHAESMPKPRVILNV